MWARAYRNKILDMVVNTTNEVERMNHSFKKLLNESYDKSLSNMAKLFKKYKIANIQPWDKLKNYVNIDHISPKWCWNQPPGFQNHIADKYETAKSHMSKSNFSVISEGPKWKYKQNKFGYVVSSG